MPPRKIITGLARLSGGIKKLKISFFFFLNIFYLFIRLYQVLVAACKIFIVAAHEI